MSRVSITLPEELGSGREAARQPGEVADGEARLGTRADGAGELEPVIVRWFETWARGEAERPGAVR